MSADILREAASLIRERAEAATSIWGCDKWEAFDAAPRAYEGGAQQPAYLLSHVATANEHGSVLLTSPWPDTEIVHHAASWHPAVALAVADWLDHEAQIADEDAADGYSMGPRYPGLAVARAYLGRDA